MEKDKVRFRDFEHNSSNPFLNLPELEKHFIRKTRKFKSGDNDNPVFSSDTGEIIGTRVYENFYWYDNEEFTKLFNIELMDWLQLSKGSEKLFSYIVTKLLKPDHDQFILEYKVAQQLLGYKTPNPIFDGLVELIEKKVIARGQSTSVFYINPHLLFNGSRVKFVRTLIKKSKGGIKTGKDIMSNISTEEEV